MNNLVGYWDMESTYSSGGTIMLKNLSKCGNYGEIIGNHNIGNVKGKIGNATDIDGNWHFISMKKSDNTNLDIYLDGIKVVSSSSFSGNIL